jgi:hypothetical protein
VPSKSPSLSVSSLFGLSLKLLALKSAGPNYSLLNPDPLN